MRKRVADVALAGALLVAQTAGVAAADFASMDRERELSQTADEMRKGQVFLTHGLVCDKSTEIDAVITLSNSGETLVAAVEQINAGANVPRCVVGKLVFARYEGKSLAFSAGSHIYQVHKVSVIAVGKQTPHGILPLRLEKPMTQYVVSADRSIGI